MEDVLDLYEEPYDPRRPKVCFDETSRQLVAETRVSVATRPGQVARYDFEYQRNGTRNLFLFIEPQRGWRRGGDGKTHYARLWPPDAMVGRSGLPRG